MQPEFHEYNSFCLTLCRSEKEREAKSGWRDSFLMERGKMTSVRYEKIKDSIRGGGMGSALSNATRSSSRLEFCWLFSVAKVRKDTIFLIKFLASKKCVPF